MAVDTYVWCSLGAALAIKELIAAENSKELSGLWNPAEEDLAGKVYMARAGLFNDLDVCLIGRL
jgi:aminobenzoyl-glutamate utilization protein B